MIIQYYGLHAAVWSNNFPIKPHFRYGHFIRYFPRIIIVISSNFLPLADSKSAYEMFQSFVVIMFENLRVALLLLLRCCCAATALLRVRLQLLMKVNKPVAR